MNPRPTRCKRVVITTRPCAFHAVILEGYKSTINGNCQITNSLVRAWRSTELSDRSQLTSDSWIRTPLVAVKISVLITSGAGAFLQHPGIEPGAPRWQREILRPKLPDRELNPGHPRDRRLYYRGRITAQAGTKRVYEIGACLLACKNCRCLLLWGSNSRPLA